MAFTITFKDSVSFAVQLANKLGWRMTHSTDNVEYIDSVISWALHKICVERQVEMVVVSHVEFSDIPDIVKSYAAMVIHKDSILIANASPEEAFRSAVSALKPGPNRQSFEEASKATLEQYHDALVALAAA